jgi:tetratricopeptide (TPR) repeat protein
MEIKLTINESMQVAVNCDNQLSHTFHLSEIGILEPSSSASFGQNSESENSYLKVLDDPIHYGRQIYAALFRKGSRADQVLDSTDRIYLVVNDLLLQSIPWEYAYGPQGFLIGQVSLVRGLPAEQLNRTAGEVTTLNNAATVYRMTGQLDQAKEYYQKALDIAQKNNDLAGEAVTLNNIAVIYQLMNEIPTAVKTYEKAIDILNLLKDISAQAAALNNLAELYINIGEISKAREQVIQAYTLAQQANGLRDMQIALSNLAILNQKEQDLPAALDAYQQLYEVIKEGVDQAKCLAVLLTIASLHHELGQHPDAFIHYQIAFDLAEDLNDQAGGIAALTGIGHVMISEKRFEEARKYLEKAITYAQRLQYPAAEASALVHLATLLEYHLNRPAEAAARLQEALAVLDVSGLSQTMHGQSRSDIQQLLDLLTTQNPSENGAAIKPGQNEVEMTQEQLDNIIESTVSVMTLLPNKKEEWRQAIEIALQEAVDHQRQDDIDLFNAVLSFLDGGSPQLSHSHPFAHVVKQIKSKIKSKNNIRLNPAQSEAVSAYFNSKNWMETQSVFKKYKNALFDSNVNDFIQSMILKARQSGNSKAEEFFTTHLALLEMCRKEGIEKVFQELNAKTTDTGKSR